MTPSKNFIAQIESLMEGFESAFTQKGFKYFKMVIFGLLLTPGKTSMVRLADAAGVPEKWKCLTRFYQKGKWLLYIIPFELLSLCLSKLPMTRDENGKKVALFAVDDFLVRKAKARKMEGVARIFDHSPLPGRKAGMVKGHCWLLVTFVCRPTKWLRFLSFPLAAQMWQPKSAVKNHKYKQLGEIALSQILPWKRLLSQNVDRTVLLCDAWFSKINFLTNAVGAGFEVISRFRYDRAIYAIPEPAPEGTKGRPRKYGNKFNFNELLDDDAEVTLLDAFKYGGQKTLRVVHRIGRLRVAHKLFDISVVATRNSRGKLILLFSTDVTRSAKDIVEWYAGRWSIELAIRDMKQGLGLDSYQMRKASGINRFVHSVLACQTLVQITTVQGYFDELINQNVIPWYPCFQKYSFSIPAIREAIFNWRIKLFDLDRLRKIPHHEEINMDNEKLSAATQNEQISGVG